MHSSQWGDILKEEARLKLEIDFIIKDKSLDQIEKIVNNITEEYAKQQKASEQKFKCPCHGSGYDSEAINFEGPAPRPMDRAHVELDPQGQIVVDISRLYKQEKGQKTQFDDEGAFLSSLSACFVSLMPVSCCNRLNRLYICTYWR